MKNSTLPYWLAFAVALVALYGGFKLYKLEQNRSYGGVSQEGEIRLPPLEEFELTRSDGTPFRSADLKGKVWIASFFFSTCTGSCSRLNGNIAYLSRQPEIEGATWVSISVDPVNDTLPVLAAYAERFRADPARWVFCRHDDFTYIKRLADSVLRLGGVAYQGHNDRAVIIDKHGEIAGMFNAVSTIESKKGMEIIKRCLAEEYEPAAAPPAADAEKPAANPAEAA
jgi:protein SCO1/2